jgi:outer membrane protein OmpA-like peptidoglycan-associated protein
MQVTRTVVGATLGALLGLASVPAQGQTFDVETFRPATSTRSAFSQDLADVLRHGELNAGLVLDYAHAPLVLRDLGTNQVLPGGQVISGRLAGHVVGAIGLANVVEIGVRVPIVLYQHGSPDVLRAGASLGTTVPGDVSLGARIALLGRPGRDGFKVAVAAELDLPTGSTDDFAGDGGLGFRPRLVAGLDRGALQLALNAGYAARPRRVVVAGDFTMDDQALAGLALSYAVIPASLWALGEAAFAHVLGAPDGWRDTPGSTVAGARLRVAGPWVLQAGVGLALSAGPGTPDLRGILSFAYAPGARPQAAAPVAAAPPRPAPPPPPRHADKDAVRDVDGDKDGIADAADKCPGDPEDKDGFEDEDGCPDPDNDKDGVADAADKCPAAAEVVNGFEDEDGCPDKGLVVLKGGELETLTPVLFNTDRARVRHAFRPDLDAIAAFLKAHPEVGRCAVEGHTDGEGPEEWNAKLSLERARTVVRYLVEKGVDPARLVAIGKGGALPWSSNRTEAGRAANRRVVFHIEGVSEDQKRRQLEIQKERALKRTGARDEDGPARPEPGAPAKGDAGAR